MKRVIFGISLTLAMSISQFAVAGDHIRSDGMGGQSQSQGDLSQEVRGSRKSGGQI